jgi:hypothetical protein
MFVYMADHDGIAVKRERPKGRRLFAAASSRGRLFGFVLVFLASLPAWAQTSRAPAVVTNPAAPVIVRPPTPVMPPPSPFLDPMAAAVMQQMGVDSNLFITAEFDPPVVALGQRITYRVVVGAVAEGVSLPEKLPAVPGLALAEGGRGFHYATVGLSIQPRTTFNYRVSASAAGLRVMPAFPASANGRTIRIPEARLMVLPPGAPGVRQPMRLLVELPEGDVYIGQAVPVKLALLDAGDNTARAVSQPVVTGDAVMAEQALNRVGQEQRMIGGRMVPVPIVGVLVTPLKEGRLEFTAHAYAHCLRPGVPAGPLDAVLVDSDPVVLVTRHLPKDGELPGFTGAIGRFAVEPPHPSTNEVRAGEPLTLTVTVKGDGNLARLIPPRPARLREWQDFPPLADSSGSIQIQLRGAATFTYTLIPLSDRLRATPAIPFSYYDPQRKSYVDATIPPVPIKVLPALGGTTPSAQPARTTVPAAEDPDQPAAERELVMTGLAETPGHVSSLVPLQARPWFLVMQLLPAGALGGLWLWERRRRYLAAHPEVALRARARRRVRQECRTLRRAAGLRDTAGFIAASVSALREACAPAEAANPGALVCADVLRGLTPAEREGVEGRLVRELFAAADALRFVNQAPDAATLLAQQTQVESLLARWRARL